MENRQIPYIVHESEMARQERHIKRLWVLCIIMFLSLLMTNAGWLWYESQFEEVVTTETYQDVMQDGFMGRNMFVGGDYNGQTED